MWDRTKGKEASCHLHKDSSSFPKSQTSKQLHGEVAPITPTQTEEGAFLPRDRVNCENMKGMPLSLYAQQAPGRPGRLQGHQMFRVCTGPLRGGGQRQISIPLTMFMDLGGRWLPTEQEIRPLEGAWTLQFPDRRSLRTWTSQLLYALCLSQTQQTKSPKNLLFQFPCSSPCSPPPNMQLWMWDRCVEDEPRSWDPMWLEVCVFV